MIKDWYVGNITKTIDVTCQAFLYGSHGAKIRPHFQC